MRVKKEDQGMEVADVMEPTVTFELDPQVVEAMRKGREAMYPICTFHNVDF